MNRMGAGQAGYALVAVMILVFAMFIIGAGFFTLVGHEVHLVHSSLESQKAFWLAEGGKERALCYLSDLNHPPTSDFYVYQDVAGPDGGTYTVNCLVDTTALWAEEKAFVLDSVGTVNGVERRIRQWVKMISFAQYAMFTDAESNGQYPLWYISGDVVEGRVHTNGTLHIFSNPRFLDKVTTAADHMVGYYNHNVYDMDGWPVAGNDPYFAKGAEFGVAPIPMPTDLPDLRQLGMIGGIYTMDEVDVELGVNGAQAPVTAPGWLRYRPHSDTTGDWTSAQISSLANKVFYCENDVRIKGVLDGELTVASHRDVRIEDNLLYRDSDASGAPRPGCDDLLGVVAERNILIAETPANQNDLIVDGVLMALDTSITVENYNHGSPRGTLSIWGGMIQKYRGAVGQFSNSTLRHGYQKNYHYDQRVTGRTPPNFPMTGVYEVTAWEETWDDSDPF